MNDKDKIFLKDLKNIMQDIDKIEGKEFNVVNGQFVENDELNKIQQIPLAKDEKGAAIEATFHAAITKQAIDKEISDQVNDEELIDMYINKLLDNLLRT